MKAEQKKDFNNKSVVDNNPIPLMFGGVDPIDLPTDKEGCMFLVLVMLVILIMIILLVYVAVSR